MVARDYRIWGFILLAILVAAPGCGGGGGSSSGGGDQPHLNSNSYIIDHTCTTLASIPESAINNAKAILHIAYGHTSHGSQLISGMTGLLAFKPGYNTLYAWNESGSGGALDLDDNAMGGDVGYYPQWVNNTRSYLGAPNENTHRGRNHPEVNVIIWSWCGQLTDLTEQRLRDEYLIPMTALEDEYRGIKFVYMTGHLDGTGLAGNLHQRNEQIRTYCRNNHKWLYDFADIESYAPGGSTNYMALMANDNCDYDSDSNGSLDRNWALEWQTDQNHRGQWYSCSPAHTQDLNGNLKAYAAWWLWAQLAGWDGP